MSRSVRDGSALREVSETVIRDGGNVARVVSERWVRGPDNVLRQVWGGSSGGGGAAMVAQASPAYVSGSQSRALAFPVTTNSTSVSVNGGQPPYAYQWSTATGFSVSSPSSAATNFVGTSVQPGEDRTATFTCAVTDANGASVTSNTVTATVSNYGSP